MTPKTYTRFLETHMHSLQKDYSIEKRIRGEDGSKEQIIGEKVLNEFQELASQMESQG